MNIGSLADRLLKFCQALVGRFRGGLGQVNVVSSVIFSCMLAYGSGNRDERKWGDDAHVYDIHRNPRGHLGFGGGVHACLGTAIARLATQIAFEEFLTRYPDFERVDDVLPWVPSSNFRSPLKLNLSVL